MKLYSKKQLTVFIIITAVVTFLITAAIFLNIWPRSSRATEDDLQTALPREQSQDNSLVRTVAYNDTVRGSGNQADYSLDELENIRIYEQYNEAVVNITSITIGYTWFLEAVPQEGSGSGSIIDQKGNVLTNYHVVQDADRLTITLADGSDYEGNIVGVDPENDLAVVHFDPQGRKLTTIPFAQTGDIRIGQKVLAIGNPFGLERTLTTGVVSAQRPIRTESDMIMQGAIQTDASINPGNSGGPLLNSKGEMIGINTMIYSPSGGSVGIGFAVPVVTAKRVIPDLLKYGRVQRGWIDIDPVPLTRRLARYANLPVSSGILVSEVQAGSNAYKAGIRGGNARSAVRYGRNIIYLGGDIIIEIDGLAVASYSDLYNALEDNKPGETVSVKIMRDKKLKTITVKLSERRY
jgi:S1-C subfamily serine protease